ncbi:MAG: hypothetical protein OXE46_13435 [Chloroflexi bacterium]|nr:hypothetical protein [Chloroflexota bacterium]
MSTVTYVIQNKVFTGNDDYSRFAQVKSYRRRSAVTQYIKQWILPLKASEHDKDYRIAATSRCSDGKKLTLYFSVDRWMELRHLPVLALLGLEGSDE